MSIKVCYSKTGEAKMLNTGCHETDIELVAEFINKLVDNIDIDNVDDDLSKQMVRTQNMFDVISEIYISDENDKPLSLGDMNEIFSSLISPQSLF